MRVLSQTCVVAWDVDGGYLVPRSIDTNCPFCERLVNFALVDKSWDHPRSTIGACARCSGCNERVSIWVVKPITANSEDKKDCGCLTIFPANKDSRNPIEGSQFIPDALRRSYNEAVQVYNAKVWSATATLCRRTLEGVVKERIGEKGKERSLHEMLHDLPNKVDLGKPITSLANSVRLGGNIGAHFMDEGEPDQELARTMLDLLEYLLEYFYTIPSMIENAKAVLDKPKNDPRIAAAERGNPSGS